MIFEKVKDVQDKKNLEQFFFGNVLYMVIVICKDKEVVNYVVEMWNVYFGDCLVIGFYFGM